MFFLFGRRYPYLAVIIGAALLVAGLAIGDIRLDVTGGVGLVLGGYRCIARVRGRALPGGGNGLADGSGSGGSLR
jgi:hypothetical protein